MAQKLTLDTEGRNAADPDFDANNIKQYGVMFGTDWNVYMPFILSAGGGYLNESMDGLGLNDEKSAQILQNFADLINVYHVSPTAVQKNAMPSAATALAAKQTAMYIDGSWNHLDLMNSGCNWGVRKTISVAYKSRKFRKNHRIIQNFMDACTDRILY